MGWGQVVLRELGEASNWLLLLQLLLLAATLLLLVLLLAATLLLLVLLLESRFVGSALYCTNFLCLLLLGLCL
jgi:hypothetical protein